MRISVIIPAFNEEGNIGPLLERLQDYGADEILAEVTRDMPEPRDIARRLFCLLVEGEGENAVRRLAEVAEVIEGHAITSTWSKSCWKRFEKRSRTMCAFA